MCEMYLACIEKDPSVLILALRNNRTKLSRGKEHEVITATDIA